MTRDALEEASRQELIEFALSADAAQKATQARLDEIEGQLRWFKNQLFGTKSERRVDADSSTQLSLGEAVAKAAIGEEVEEAPETVVREHARTKSSRKQGDEEEPGLRFDDTVPVQTTVVIDPKFEGIPEDELELISEKKSYQLAQRPASYVVLETIRPVMKHKSTGEISCPAPPPSVLPGTYAEVSLLAGMLVDKFAYHLPLYRQHQRIEAAGITVSRSSLTNWTHDALDLLEPIYKAQLKSILTSQVLAMDETPIRAGRKPRSGSSGKKGKMKTGYFWPVYGDRDEVAFPFAASRAKKEAEEILGAYCGTLLTDGYSAYAGWAKARKEVTHALCWSHTRRGFVRAEEVESERSAEALRRIRDLYVIEKVIRSKKLENEAKQAERGQRSKPLVAEFFEWLTQEMAESALLPTNPFTKAAHYALDRKKGLEVFLSDPDVPMDTNHLERTLRPIPLGKKNWMFCWTEVGAEKVGWAQSLIATCRIHGIDPYAYLVDVLQRVDSHPQSRVEELTPRLWKEGFGDQPMTSRLV
jgi:transposase